MISLRDARAEKRKFKRELEEERALVKKLKQKVSVLNQTLEEKPRRVMTVFQDSWNQRGCSETVQFDAPNKFSCRSVEQDYRAAMPGVCGVSPMESGYYTQSIALRGVGYTLVGLVSSDEEKKELKYCNNWHKLPFMSPAASCCGILGTAVTIQVDMVNRRAELYDGDAMHDAMRSQGKPIHVWENLPDKVWVAAATKRNSEREVILLPRTNSNI